MAVEYPSDHAVQNDEARRNVAPRPPLKTQRPTVPRLQLLAIILIAIAEPVTATVIYPFINQFVRSTGVTLGDERKTGYYAGLVESVFFLAEALTVVQFGWLSDQIGRKPVLLLGPLGLAFSMVGFGLSNTFLSMLLFRCMQGASNGNIGVSKSVLAEISVEGNIDIGELFAMLPLMWSMGITVGPIIGGIFSNPSDRWPEVFGQLQLLKEHPYFLPCAIAGGLAFISFLYALIVLRETLPSAPIRQRCLSCLQRLLGPKGELKSSLVETSDFQDYGAIESQGSDPQKPHNPPTTPPPSYKEVLLVRSLQATYVNYFFIAFTEMAHNALLPLMYSTSVSLGGLGLDSYQIGLLMGTFGFANATLQLKYLARLVRAYGPRTIYICSYMSFLVCVGLFPVASYLCRVHGGVNWVVGCVIAVQLIAQIPILAGYSSMHILVVGNAPKGALGVSNGIAQMIASSMRSLAPAIATSLFSISLERDIAGGHMVYYVLLLIIILGIRMSFFLPHNVSSNPL